MKRLRRTLLMALLGSAVATTAPIIPTTEDAVVWWEPEHGAKTCYAAFDSGIKEFPCAEYWKSANSENARPPKQTDFKSPVEAISAKAAIAFDTVSTDVAAATCPSGTSISWSHTTSGSERLLFVAVNMYTITDANRDVTSATYNGVAMTPIRRDNNNTIDRTTEIYYLAAPASGSNTLTLGLAGTTEACGVAMSLTGVDQVSPLDAQNGTTVSNGNAVSVDVTTVAADAWVLDSMSIEPNSSGIAPSGNQTSRAYFEPTSSTLKYGASSRGPVASPGPTTMSWSESSIFTPDWSLSAASFKPSSGSATTPNFLDFSDF